MTACSLITTCRFRGGTQLRRKSCTASLKPHESVRKAPGARSAGQAAAGRHHRRRQIRRHVHCASAAHAGGASRGHRRPLAGECARQPRARGLEAGTVRCRVARCGAQGAADAHLGRLECACRAPGRGDRRRSHRESDRCSRACPRCLPKRQARGDGDGRGGCVLRAPAREKSQGGGRRVQPRYGDQPAIICDLVDWARAAGFPVVAAGRGHKWLPHFAQSTPETVWGYYGLTPEQARVGGLNPKMFNSFLDGSKPAIEATAVCNATGLTPAPDGLAYPPASIEDLPTVMRPKPEGGQLHHKGQVEVVSSLDRDGRAIPYDIRFGVWVVFEGETDYIRRCFTEYGVRTDPSGRYASMYKRWHLIGLEVGISVASVGLR